jgi:hypothetical protein
MGIMTIEQLTELLGWASVINIGYLFLATMFLAFLRKPIFYIHSKLFGVDETELNSTYFNFLSNYKIATLVLLVTPYLALKIMGQ